MAEKPDRFVATASLLSNLALPHMRAAERFSRRVHDIEREHAGDAFGPFWDEIWHCSVAAVFASVASLEAYANELFFDRAKVFPGYTNRLLDTLWEAFEQKRILDKFAFALLLRDKPQLDRGASPCQDVAILVELRNALTHFKPEWDTAAVRHKKISAKLKGRFRPGPFLSDRHIFPRQWATHGATKWAVTSCLDFARAFEAAADLPAKYQPADGSRTFEP